MLKNYFTVALRNFWRNKTFSVINVLGLSIWHQRCPGNFFDCVL